ncbi:MAG TPA: hypothetical protein VFX33_09680 [Actinomycetales bacterium]|nr:hypothetical protein [Actinomycetales bacterium]
MANRSIFRESALEAYRRSTTHDVLPRLTSWPLIAFAWVMLGGLLAAAVLAWSLRVPAFVDVSGVVLDPEHRAGLAQEGGAALFVPEQQQSRVRPGQMLHGDIGGTAVQGVVVTVQPQLIGPYAARQRFGLPTDSNAVDKPAAAVIVRLAPAPPASYDGSRMSGRIQVGSQRLLSFVPVIGTLLGNDS